MSYCCPLRAPTSSILAKQCSLPRHQDVTGPSSSSEVAAVRQPADPFNLVTGVLAPRFMGEHRKGEARRCFLKLLSFSHVMPHPSTQVDRRPHLCSFALNAALILQVPTSDFLFIEKPNLRLVKLQYSTGRAILKLTVTTRLSLLMQKSKRQPLVPPSM